jgi:hypothetical protein
MVVWEELNGPEGQGDFSPFPKKAGGSPSISGRESPRIDTVLKRGWIRPDFWAMIGLPNTHFVNLFIADSVKSSWFCVGCHINGFSDRFGGGRLLCGKIKG